MLFSSLTFLLVFLPIFLILYFLFKNIKVKNVILLVFSLIFYAWGEPVYVILMILSIVITYLFGILISKYDKHKKLLFVLSIACLLSSLLFFKYSNFLIDNFNFLFHLKIKKLDFSLPIGISFYTFQAISYLADLYLNKISVQKNLLKLGLYISLFPQLIAGPIVRYETIEKEIDTRVHSLKKVERGLKRFIIGLSKKVILANSMAIIADTILDSFSSYGTILLWMGAIAYTLQIYYDFSGYSDMAIGLGQVCGFNFLENFNYPYIAKSITDFWRRWHISLSSWFRDYVYIPLGGSRVSVIRNILNILIVWMLTGFWHGASWNFILWGLYFAILLILEKFAFKNIINKFPNIFRYIITLFLVIISWVIFRNTNILDLGIILKNMFIYKYSDIIDFIFKNTNLIFSFYFVVPAIVFCIPLKKIIKIGKNISNNLFVKLFVDFIYIFLFIINISFLASNTYNPFIYFRF